MISIHSFLPKKKDAGGWEGRLGYSPSLQYLILFYAAYVCAAGFGHGLAIVPGVDITFWPPAGIFVGTLLLTARRSWPWWVVTGGIAELTCNGIWFGNQLHFAAIYYLANSLEALTAAWLIRAVMNKPFRLEATEEVVALVVLGACVAPLVGATLIASTDALINKHSFATAWQLVWLGDASGLLITTPLTVVIILAWRERRKIPPARMIEAATLVMTLLGVGWLALRGFLPTIYMALPPILWTAVRFQMQGAAAALGLITLVTAVSTMRGQGEFAGVPELQHEKIVMLQTFLVVSAVSALIVAALSVQRQRALVNLQAANAELEARVAARTANLRESEERLRLLGDNLPRSVLYQYMHDREGNSKFLHVSAGIEQLNGVSVADVLRDPQTLFQQFPAEYLQVLMEAEHRSRSELTNFDLEAPMRRADGELRWMSLHSQPRRLPDGSTIWEGVQIDITDRKNRELNLAFIADLSRDLTTLSTPLDIMKTACARIVEHMRLAHVSFVEIKEGSEEAMIIFDHPANRTIRSNVADLITAPFVRQRLAAGHTSIINDLHQMPDDAAMEFVNSLDMHALLTAPYISDGRWKFALSVLHRQPHVWCDNEIELVQVLSERIYLRLERAQAEEQLRIRNRQLNLLASISRKLISGSQAEVQMLSEVFDEVAKTLDMGIYFNFLLDESHTLRLIASKGLTAEQQSEYSKIEHGQLPCAHVAQQRERIIIEDLPQCERDDIADLCKLGASCYAGFPLQGREAVIGTVSFACPHRQRFDADELQLIQTVCDQVAITLERSRAETHLRESEERFRTIFDSIDEGFCTIEVMFDRAGRAIDYRFEEINPAMERLTGLKNALGKSVRALVPELEEFWFETYGAVALTGESIRFESYSASMGRWFDVHASRVGDAQSRRVALVFNNITERKMAAIEIQLGAERLRNAAEAAGFVMMHADLATGRITYSQELKHLLGSLDDVGPYPWRGPLPSWVHPDDRDVLSRFYGEFSDLVDGQSRAIDHRIIQVDGTERWIRLQAKRLRATQGEHHQATQIIGTLLDITAQRMYEQSLEAALDAAEAANRAKSAFLANMSHEIRTPMTAILGYTDLVAEQITDGESAQHLRTIKRNGAFLLEIINDILDLSKIEAGKLVVHRQRFAPDRLIEDVRSIMEVRAKENNVMLSVEYKEAIPSEIESDPKSLKQILINLVGNAIKFTKQGTVRIVAGHVIRNEESFLELDIVDTGIGMSAEQLSRMFEPFSQADASVTRNFGGTGLGLAISDRLAKTLGGSISVASELGKGSTFKLTVAIGNIEGLAMIVPQTIRDRPVSADSREAPSLHGHILIVDDRREIRYLTKHFLITAGATVVEAEDGEQAIAMVVAGMSTATSIDLILLDMQMPRLDGYQTAAQLRQLGFERPIVALTADAMQGDMRRCLESGCNDYLSKPIDKHKMLSLVRHYLDFASSTS